MIINLKNNLILKDWTRQADNVYYRTLHDIYNPLLGYIIIKSDFRHLKTPNFQVMFKGSRLNLYRDIFNSHFKSNFNFIDIELSKQYVDKFLLKIDNLISYT